ncbi:MAG: TIGR03435 family protein [Acidobacteriaceae bacterium]
MKISIFQTGLSRILCLAITLTAFAMPNAIAQQGANGAEQQSIVPMSPMAADAHPSFEVATIKPADPNKLKGNFFIGGHRIVIENQSVNSLMVFAYAIHQQQIVDGPAWLDTRKYDIVGQADVEGVPNLRQIQEMLQKLLESRFNLRLHREKRDLAIYTITVAKGGPRLAKSPDSANGLPTQSGSGSGGQQVRKFTNNTMSDFALGMQAFMDRPVVDKSGLAGRYDFVLKWTPDESNTTDPNAAPGIFTAVQEQLGLKLEPAKGPTDVLVVDHIEEPSEN